MPTLLQSKSPYELRQGIVKRFGMMESDRERWRPTWKELSQYILPDNGVGLQGYQNEWEQIEGGKTDFHIVDGSSTRYVDIFAAGMQSGLTSPSRPWFKLGLHDQDLANYQPVKVWLEDIEARMRMVFDASNFYASLHHLYRELPVFGTGAQIILEDYDNIIRCRPFTIGEYWLSLDSSLRVDTLYRHLWMRACQLEEQFGYANMSLAAQSAYDNSNVKAMFQVIQAIEPNDEYTDTRDLSKKKWRSVYFELGGESNKILSQEGFDDFPCQAPRWHVIGSKVYGRGRGHFGLLADTKMLQRFAESQLVNYDKAIEPPVVASPSMKNEQINTIPGGVSYSDDMGSQNSLRPLYEVPDMLESGERKIESIKTNIREWLFTDLFMMLANQPTRSNVTATEIQERHEEKMLVLGPVLERVHGELLDPSIARTFSIMARMGALPPPPPIKELRGQKIKVEYISALAVASKMTQLTGIDQFIGRIGAIAQINPDCLDNVNFDAYVQVYAEDAAIPAKLLNDPQVVAARRAARQKQKAMEQQMQTTQQMAEAAKTAAAAPLGGNTVLSQAMGRVMPPGVPAAT